MWSDYHGYMDKKQKINFDTEVVMDARKKRTFKKFQEMLREWVVDPHGDGDYCPECRKKYLARLRNKCVAEGGIDCDVFIQMAIDCSSPLARHRLASTRFNHEGWFTWCMEGNCKNNVFVPF